MKEFISAVEDEEFEAEREAKIVALMEEESISREDAESKVDDDPFIEFKLDERVMRAYKPTDGQLTFMLAALGRGQSADQRFAAIMNIMLASLRGDDADYLEGRLLTRDRQKRLSIKQIEGIFEHLTEEWFARPTQSSSDSA